jgi:hypothetical protein
LRLIVLSGLSIILALTNLGASEKATLDNTPVSVEGVVSSESQEIGEEESHPGFLTDAFELKGLDKVTARTFEISGTLNTVYDHKTISLMVKKCWKSGPDEAPESIAYVDIFEKRQGEESFKIFSGWMFASEHSVSALEHPVYDVWVKACVGKEKPYKAIVTEKAGTAAVSVDSSLDSNEAVQLSQPNAKVSDRMQALYRGLKMGERSRQEGSEHTQTDARIDDAPLVEKEESVSE